MKLHLYLFNASIKNIYDCFNNDYNPRANSKLIEIPCNDNTAELIGYQYKPDLSIANWANSLMQIFSFETKYLKTRSPGFIIFHHSIKLKRIFCITFGKGFNYLNRDLIESKFGLVCTANLISKKASAGEKALREIDFVSLGLNPSHTKKHFDDLVDSNQLDIDLSSDLVKLLSGIPSENDLTDAVDGADYLNLKSKFEIQFFKDKCEDIFTLFQKDDYKKYFPFIDNMDIVKNNQLKKILDDSLLKAINNDDSKLILSCPFFLNYPIINSIRIHRKKASENINVLEKKEIFDFYKAHSLNKSISALKETKITIIYDDEEKAPVSLYKFLYYETKHDDHRYIFHSGGWFKVQETYVKNLQSILNKYENDFLSLPEWNEHTLKTLADQSKDSSGKRQTYQERIYNEQVSDSNKWLNFDRVSFNIQDFPDFGSYKSKVEFCDLIDPINNYLFFIKHFGSSSDISHLMVQVLTTASIYNTYRQDRAKLLNILQNKSQVPLNINIDKEFYFIIAIASKKNEPLSSSMPILSLISLNCIIDRLKYMSLHKCFSIIKISCI